MRLDEHVNRHSAGDGKGRARHAHYQELSLLALLVQPGAQFTCFTAGDGEGRARHAHSCQPGAQFYLLYWYQKKKKDKY
jgi:hypothetical protein